MKLADYFPAVSPTLDQQRDALHKGLGRAVQWATTKNLDEAILLDACLHDKRFDVSVNEYRGDWLWRLVQSVHAVDRFRTSLLEGLYSPAEDDAKQLCELGFHYAANGDNAFRSRLYQIVEERPFAEMRWLGEEEIIRLDGEAAFLLAARIRGSQLESREWGWDDFVLVDETTEQLGEDRVRQSLDTATDEEIGRFRETWLRSKSDSESANDSRQGHRARMQRIPLADILSGAESSSTKQMNFRGWGMWATESDLEVVYGRLLSAREPEIIINYLRVFSRREFPRIVPEVVSLTQHADPEVRRWAFNSLKNNKHLLVRELAVSELERGFPNGLALGLFVKNYEEGDEQQIVDSIELPVDENQLHWLLMDATKVLEENAQADCSKLGLVAYALNPCSSCRYFAARLLRDRRVVPNWLKDECRFDSESAARRLFTEP